MKKQFEEKNKVLPNEQWYKDKRGHYICETTDSNRTYLRCAICRKNYIIKTELEPLTAEQFTNMRYYVEDYNVDDALNFTKPIFDLKKENPELKMLRNYKWTDLERKLNKS